MSEQNCRVCSTNNFNFEIMPGNNGNNIPPLVSLELVIRSHIEPKAQLWIINKERTAGVFMYVGYCPACGRKLTHLSLDEWWNYPQEKNKND